MAKRSPRHPPAPTTPARPWGHETEAAAGGWDNVDHSQAFDETPASAEEDAEDGRPGRPSRREKRRGAEEAMALGQRLVELAGPRRDALSLPDEVREAVEEALRMRSHAARKRQMLFLGKVLRNCDELDDIATALDEISEQDRRGTLAFQRVESWRERLLHEGEPALDAFCALYPAAARAELLALMQEAGRGRDHPRGAGAARALFRALRSQLASAAPKA